MKDRKKVSIITIHRVHNYGTALQAVATQEVFRQAGYEVEIVDYITPKRTLSNQIRRSFAKNGSSTKGLVKSALKTISLCFREFVFDRFLSKELNLTKRYITSDYLKKDPPVADIYVTGSDQTWNQVYNDGIDHGYFLDFLPDTAIRVAYAASFGRDCLPDKELAEVKPYIQKYQHLSLREDTGIKILEQMGRKDGIQLIDPTLQLSSDFWHRLESKPLYRHPYLLLFLIYEEDANAIHCAKTIAKQRGMKLVKLSWELKKPTGIDQLYTHRGPRDFLSLMANASFIVTNSFHGLAYAVNYEKEFLVIPRTQYNTRLESLLRMFQLEERSLPSEYRNLDRCDLEYFCHSFADMHIDYSQVNRILEGERRKAEEYLENIKNSFR